ncbi:MAG: hypothetical protein ACI9LO_000229 [Planctomycetota bacterium]|jgi:hypothetical protein
MLFRPHICYLLIIAIFLASGSIKAAESRQGSIEAAEAKTARVENIYYGNALFQYFQNHEFEAITRLMVALEKPHNQIQRNESRLLLADLFYRYGLYDDSRQIFAQLLSSDLSDSIQNRIWFNLARLNYDQRNDDLARDLLSKINDTLPPHLEAERNYMLSSLYLGSRQYQQAEDSSAQISKDSRWRKYADYNLAVTQLEEGDYSQGQSMLMRLGDMDPADEEDLAIRDQSNLALGLKQLRMGQTEAAIETLSRVRLLSPVSSQALLATGWAWYKLENFDKALLLWRELIRKNAVDAATDEALLAIPEYYVDKGQDKLAISHYESAAHHFDAQLGILDSAALAVGKNNLIAALYEHKLISQRGSFDRLPPHSAVTVQLLSLLASAEFHRQIKHLQQLLDINQSLLYWDLNLPALDLMLQERRKNFQQKLPLLQQSTSFEKLDTLRSSRDSFAQSLQQIESTEDHRALASPEEKEQLERLDRIAGSISVIGEQRNTVYQQDMHRFLSGILHWNQSTDYPVRHWRAKKQLIELDRALAISTDKAQSLSTITESTRKSFSGFQQRIDAQQAKISVMKKRVEALVSRQHQNINQLAFDTIESQREKIISLRLGARFALARLYDKLASQP